MTPSRPRDRSAAMPVPNAPTPGRTTRAASRTTAGSAVTTGLTPRRRNAPAIDARFATPESTITTERPLGGRHVVEPRRCDRLPQRERRRFERSFGPVMVVLAPQHIHVQRHAPRGCERAQHMWDVFAREPANPLAAQTERYVAEGPAGEIHDRPSQRFVERRERPPETVDAAALAQCLVERFPNCERAVFGGVVVVHLQIAFTRQRAIEPRVTAERVEQVVEETDAGLHIGLPGAIEIERHTNRRFARRAC